ncbi:MAG TPA: hypothetical protein PKE30_06710 [Niabella sp.]|nr:hypothetical protein [Niabella sp.]
MGRKKCLLLYFLHLALAVFTACLTATAQTEYVDTVPVEPPLVVDSVYVEEYEDEEYYDNAQSYEDSVRKARANAFDTLGNHAGDAIAWRKLDNGYVQRLKNNPNFDYVKNGIPKPKVEAPKEQSFDMNRVWLYIAIVVFVIILAWYVIENDLFLFRKKAVSGITATAADREEDPLSVPFPEAIKEAVQSKNYRLAVRLHYLQLLKTLSEKGIISYQPDKTNFDYLLQVRSTTYYYDFFSATRNYEYSWYGLFPIDEAQYLQIENTFSNFHQKIKA